MARVNLVNNQTFDNSVVTENGVFNLYESEKISIANSINALEVVITYDNNLPDPETGGVNYKLSALIETYDDVAGTWHPIHYQFEPFIKAEQGNKHVLILAPDVFNLDEGVANYINNGFGTVAIESKKQGHLPDDFRIVIQVNENGFGSTKPFQSVDMTINYLAYAV